MGYDRDHLRGVAITTAVLMLPALSVALSWLMFLSPLPLIYYPIAYGVDRGFKIIFHGTLVACGIALLSGTSAILMLSLSLMPAGFVVAKSVNRREPVISAFTHGTIVLALTWLLAGLLISGINHVNIYREVLHEIDTGLAGAYEVYLQAPDIPLDVKAELQPAFARIRQVVPKVMPGVMAVMTFSTIWFNIVLGNWLLRKKGLPGWQDMTQWRIPDPWVWLFISAGGLLFMPGSLGEIGLNLMIVMVTLYFMQGFEVMNHLCAKWSVPHPIRLMIIFFLVIQAYGFVLLALLGLADIWADFRKPKSSET